MKSPNPCPECGVHEWWTRYYIGKMVLMFGSGGTPGFRYCYYCGHQEKVTVDPEPWPADFTFPLSDQERDFYDGF